MQSVPRAQTGSYGIVKLAHEGGLDRVVGIVEKPSPKDAPSTLAVIGRYILTPRIFHHLANINPGAGGEIQLTDGIARLMLEERIFAHTIEGTRYDCGSKFGYLQATVGFGVKHPEAGEDFRAWLKAFGSAS